MRLQNLQDLHRLDQSSQPHVWRPLLPRLLVLSALGVSVLSCSGDTLNGPPPLSPTQAYWALQVNYHAINMATVAPENTVQLTATALNAAGTPLVGLGPVSYTAVDTTVTVSPTGLVTGRYVTLAGNTQVVISLQDTLHRVTHTDTVFIQVTDTVPQHPLTTFSLQPARGDSAKRAIDFGGGGFVWPVTAIDATGNTACNANTCALQMYYTSSTPTVAAIDRATGQVSPRDTGRVIFTATSWVYGVVQQASVKFTVGYAAYPGIIVVLDTVLGVPRVVFQAPKVLVLGVGANVLFHVIEAYNAPSWPADVVFDKPDLVDTASVNFSGVYIAASPTGSGNILPFGTNTGFISNLRSRSFPVPGTYRYHSSVFPSDTSELVIKKEDF